MDYTEIFDRYLDGRLTGKELEDFRQRLESDPEFKKDLEKFRTLHYAAEKVIGKETGQEEEIHIDEETDQVSKEDIAAYGKERRGLPDHDMSVFMNGVKLAEQKYFESVGRGITKIRIAWYAAAAAVFAAIIVSVFYLVRQNQMNRTDIFSAYFKPYVMSEKIFELTRSSDDFYYAVQIFEAGDYARADILFRQLEDSSQLRIYALFYAGLTYIELGKWDAAIGSFINAIACGENQMVNASRWYLGLCYIKIDEVESARIQFEILSKTKNEYAHRSRQILRILQKR